MADKNQFLADLRAHIARHHVTQKGAALAWSMSVAYLNQIVLGNKPPNDKILKEVGYTREKVEVFRKVKR